MLRLLSLLLLSDLVTLRSQSPFGVIHLTDDLVSRFLTSPPIPRPYSLLVFFDAAQLCHKSDLHLLELRTEFDLLPLTDLASFSHLADSMDEFIKARLVLSVGEICRSPSVSGRQMVFLAVLEVIATPFAIWRVLRGETMSHDSIVEFVEARSGLFVGKIRRSSPVSGRQMVFLVVLEVIATLFTI